MKRSQSINPDPVQAAFLANERDVRIQNYRVACVLAMVFMPAGASLDYLVYRDSAPLFFKLRVICSALLFAIWWLVKTEVGSRHYKLLGLVLPALPSFFISWMIAVTQGPVSPYYAGLNLVLLGAALVLRWTLADSIIVFAEVLAMYFGACFLHRYLLAPADVFDGGIFFNNAYFLCVTGVFVVIGSLFYNRLRYREFALRYELDQNKRHLEESHQRLLELDHLKNRFFANISHELRTPLTLLIAPLENLIHRFGPRFDPDTNQTLQSMYANAMRLLKLINDLLDLVRLESGRVEVRPEPVGIAEFLGGLASAAREVAEQKGLRLETRVSDDVGVVMVDRDKLEKIVLNLQFNAIKFTPSGGRIELRARVQEDHLVIEVEDTGVGIPDDKLHQVFDRFVQVDDSAQRKFQGAGIGLALVREFTELMGGSTSVWSEIGRGSRFTVRLPCRRPDAIPAPANPTDPISTLPAEVETPADLRDEWLANLYRRAELFPVQSSLARPANIAELPADGSRLTVLVADDEPDMRRFLSTQLSRAYHVVEAANGQEAVEKTLHVKPMVVLLDMMMPEMDGIQACRELRANAETRSTPIIMLTARADEETKLQALAAGANDYLTKPFIVAELEARVRNLAESARHERSLAEQKKALEEALDKLKETEIELVQTEKMASLGRMSAGIIHEINNPLNFATTGLFTLRSKGRHLASDQQAEYAEILGDIEEGIGRVKTIVSDLRAFAHRENTQTEPVVVAEAVESALRFLSHELKDRVTVINQLPANLAVIANRNKLIQVAVNLLQNSLDATASKVFPEGRPTIWIEGRVNTGKVTVSFRDNGEGIAQEHLDKVFDPFFTTKDVGEGMGLGLSICYRIVQEFQGRITVRSEPGNFCEFTLEFPMIHEAASAAITA